MSPLRMIVSAVGAALVMSVAPGHALSARAAPAVGDGPGEVSLGVVTERTGVVAGGLVFPVRGPTSYGAAHHDYPAADVFADCGTRVVAPVTGTVMDVSRVDRWRPSTDRPRYRGGKSFSIVGSGVRYYGSHLRSLAGDVQPGATLEAGNPIGRVGKTGNAEYVPCHLHFGLSPECRGHGDWWIRRGVVSPYRFLRSWQHGGDLDPRHAVHHWLRQHGCQRSDVFG